MVKTIGLSDETHKRLQDVGHKSETFDAIVSRLIEYYLENTQFKNETIGIKKRV